ncbi:hypothetical protein D3C84_1066480 [compost metagenome]
MQFRIDPGVIQCLVKDGRVTLGDSDLGGRPQSVNLLISREGDYLIPVLIRQGACLA